MPRRAATVTQADVSRAIRAARAAGLTVLRIVARTGGISVETSDMPLPVIPSAPEARKRIVL